jgi:hypothetical protein
MKRRTDLEERQTFRSNRFFSGNGQWYFSTREHIDIGPFIHRDQAEAALERFIAVTMQPQGRDD